MDKIIEIDGKKMKARASALIPRLYRYHFNRDIIVDMKQLSQAMQKSQGEGSEFSISDLTIFENVAWLFFKQGGEDVGESPDEWLEHVEGVFSVYEALPQLLELWGENLVQTSKSKKK